MNIYIPFTYIIGWSEHKKFYYGCRFAKNCHPDDLWTKYFTSSSYVDSFRKEFGEPDIIKIHRTFTDKTSCLIFEEKYLTKIDAKSNNLFLNESNGNKEFNTAGKVAVKDSSGNTSLVFNTDPRFLSGELVALSKGRKCLNEESRRKRGLYATGKVAVKDSNGNKYLIDKNDPRYLSGELIPVSKGITKSEKFKETTSKRKKGKVTVKDKNGNKFEVDKNDPRYISGELVGQSKGTLMAKDNNGKIFRTTKDDPRWETGEIINPNKGKSIGKGVKKPKYLCVHCNEYFAGNMLKRYHNDNCKHKKD